MAVRLKLARDWAATEAASGRTEDGRYGARVVVVAEVDEALRITLDLSPD